MNVSTLAPATATIAPMCTAPPWLGGKCPMHDDEPFKILPVPGPDDPSPLVPLPGPIMDVRRGSDALKVPLASSWG